MIEDVRVNQEFGSAEEAPDVDDGPTSETDETGWLRSIPSNWDITRVKRLFRIVNGATPKTSEDAYWGGGILWVTPEGIGGSDNKYITDSERTLTEEALGSCGASVVPPGSIVLSIRAPIGHLAMARRPVSTNQGCRSLIPEYGVEDPRFYYYALKAAKPVLQSFGTGATFRELSNTELGLVPIPVPPRQRQVQIADYLEDITANIDILIAKKARLIDLLEEERTALITRAVTKGLDPDVPTKDSGVEWLGKVPEHWNVLSLDRITSHKCDGPFGSSLKSEHYRDNGVRVIRLQNIGWCEFIDDDRAYISEEYYEENLGDHDARPGDVLISALGDENKPAGRACPVPDDIGPAIVKADCFRFRLREEWADERFVAYQLSATADAASSALARGATRKRMTLGSVGKRTIALPPLSEQREIVGYLRREEEELRRAVDAVKHGVKLLAEYREALVTYAVTGKIDVRNKAA